MFVCKYQATESVLIGHHMRAFYVMTVRLSGNLPGLNTGADEFTTVTIITLSV